MSHQFSAPPEQNSPHTCSLPVLWLTFNSLRAVFCPHSPLTGPSKVSRVLHHLPWPCPISRQRRGTRPRSRALLGACSSRPVPLGGLWSSPAAPAAPPLPSTAVNGCTPVHDCPSTGGLACSPPPPGLHSSRARGGPRPQDPPRGLWGAFGRGRRAGASSHLPGIRPVTAMLWVSSPRAVVRMKPVPQRGQKNVCGARPRCQTTRTFLRLHPPKEPFPQKHLPCSKRPLLPAPHVPHVQEGDSTDVVKERCRACWALRALGQVPQRRRHFSGTHSAPKRLL